MCDFKVCKIRKSRLQSYFKSAMLENDEVTFESGSESDEEGLSDADFSLSGDEAEEVEEGAAAGSAPVPKSLQIKSYLQHKEKVAGAPTIPGATLVHRGASAIVYDSVADYESRLPQTNSTYDCVQIVGWHTRAIRIQEPGGDITLYALNDKVSDEAAVRALRSVGADGKRAVTGARALTAKCAAGVMPGKGATAPTGAVFKSLFPTGGPVICQELAHALALKPASEPKSRKKAASKDEPVVKPEERVQPILLNPPKPPTTATNAKRSPKKSRVKGSGSGATVPVKNTAAGPRPSISAESKSAAVDLEPVGCRVVVGDSKKRPLAEVADDPEVVVVKRSRTIVITISV